MQNLKYYFLHVMQEFMILYYNITNFMVYSPLVDLTYRGTAACRRS
jgi:hypothetical protein